MSTNESFTGVSIKLIKDYTDKDSISLIGELLEYDDDDFYEYDLVDLKLNQWCLFKDYMGVIGLIYQIENQYDLFDLNYSLSLHDFNNIVGKLNLEVRDKYMSKSSLDVKIFAHLYYNTSENPFIF